jgi:hypothetical protein
MTGNVLTTNPVTGTTAYANGAYGTPQQGFWGNTTGFGVNTPVNFGTPVYQQPTYPINTIGTIGGFTSQFIPQTVQQQQPGFLGQTIGHQQGTPQFAIQGILNSAQQIATQQALNTIQQTTPPQVLNTILQTTPPQVLPYILNALACQQVCQQVLAENPQLVQGTNPQAITQPLFQQGSTQPFFGSPLANQAQTVFGHTTGFGATTPFTTGYQAQWTPFQQAACVGCAPTAGQWGQSTINRFGATQVVPQQAWFGTPYGTW